MRGVQRGWVRMLTAASVGGSLLVAAPADAQQGRGAGSTNPTVTVGSITRPDWTDVAVRPAAGPVQIDGRMDEAAWQDAEPIMLAWQIEPQINLAAPFETDCRLTFDESHLYFGCRASDPDPTSIRAFLTDRDQTDSQDELGIVIDPFADSRRAFGFNMNPLGVQKDWVFDRGEGNDAWNAIWDSSGRITEDGWVVEAAIPFKSLRFPATAGPQAWRFFVWRGRPRSVRVTTRSVPRNPGNQCALCQMAYARGFHGMGSAANVEIAPFATGQRTDLRGAPEAPSLDRGDVVDEFGVDLRWNPSSDVALNVTVNPDFSQVEADAQQIQSNQQFALFFPERRPFFLEGAEFFDTLIDAVFTRTIADPSAGAKVTGKRGAWAFGVLTARDGRTDLLFPGSLSSRSTSIELDNTAVVGRVRRDIGGSSTVGGLFTARSGDGYRNAVGGLDALVRPFASWTVQAQALRSETQYPAEVAAAFDQPADVFSGWNWQARADFDVRSGWFETRYHVVDRGFRADGGFVSEAGSRVFDIRGGRSFWMDDHPFWVRIQVNGGGGRVTEPNGELLREFVFTSVNLQGPLQTELSLNPDRFRRRFEGRDFSVDRLNVFGEAQPTGRIGMDLFYQFGEELDFANAREAGLVRMKHGLDVRLSRAIELELDYDFKRLTSGGERIFREQIAEARAIYHFSSRLFFRSILQFRDVDRNPELYRSPVVRTSRALDTQFLLSYKLNPQSVVFLGYADASRGVRENVDPLDVLELTRMNRSFFVKLSYAWRP